MRWSLRIGSLGGTAILIHVTFLLFLIWLGAIYYRQGGADAAWQGTIFIETPVLEVMQHDIPTVPARTKLDTALRSLMQKGRPVVGVTAADGRLIGLLTVENLGEMMMVQSARPDGPVSGPWGNPRQ
jgi:hypothetical protein